MLWEKGKMLKTDEYKDVVIGIFSILAIIILLSVLGHLLYQDVIPQYQDLETKRNKVFKINITIIDKTSQIVSTGFAARTEYLILGNDNILYYTPDWVTYRIIIINETYYITTSNRKGYGYTRDHWVIQDIVQHKTE